MRKEFNYLLFTLVLCVVSNAGAQVDKGSILFEYWFNIGGTGIGDLTGQAAYPDNPDDGELRDKFDGPLNWADNYGTRVRGYLYPPEDGDYTFWISGDDYCDLYLSTDDDPANAVVIAQVPGWTSYQQWDSYPEQQSAPVTLAAGGKYYIEALMKEGDGGDSLTVAWGGPTIGDGPVIIAGQYLSPVIRPIDFMAGDPVPANNAVDVRQTLIIRWSPGADAASHRVYFGTDANAVANADKTSPEYKDPKTLGDESYDPGKLAWFTEYFWRIDAVEEDGTVQKGNVWSFTTANYLIVDDFEGYDGDNQIWYAWHDGVGYGVPGSVPYFAGNGTGAVVGDETTPSFTEETIVHSGSQSIPYTYDNNKQGFAKYSEAELTLTTTHDWTEKGVTDLSLWFRGYPASTGSFVDGPVGTYTMTGSGADIWSVNGVEADEFHFAYKMLTGPGSMVAKVESIENTNNWAKAGVMIRETLNPDSAHAMMVVTPAQGVSFQRRPGTSETSLHTTTGDIEAPHWVKIERDMAGNFTGYYSADGSTWTLQGTESIPMGTNVYIGLALTSHDAALTCQAVFSNVTTTGTVGPQWAHQDISIAGNDAEPMYIAVSNRTGTSAVVYHDDPAAATIDTWTEWVIPLQTFADQGINLTDVDRIAIGLGTRGNMTVPGGSGTLFIDDIRLYLPDDDGVYHTITSTSGPYGSISPAGSVIVNHGSNRVFTADPDTDWEVDKWFLDVGQAQISGLTYTLSNIQTDHTVSVTFKRIQHTITSSSGPYGSIEPDGTTIVKHGDDLTFTATPDAGFVVDKWFLGIDEVQNGGLTYTLSNILADHEVNVSFNEEPQDPLQKAIDNAGPGYSVYLPEGTFETGGVIDLKGRILEVTGTSKLVSYIIIGEGNIDVLEGAELILDDCLATCRITGQGTVSVPAGSRVTLLEEAKLSVHTFECEGSLRVTDSATISDVNMSVADAIFDENSSVSNSSINVGPLPPALLRIEDNASITDSNFYAGNEGYLELDPASFGGTISDNRIHITIESDTEYLDTNLLESRGRDVRYLPRDAGAYPGSIPPYGMDSWIDSWAIDRLEVTEGTRAVLANRFDYQAPFDEGGNQEVLYVKELVLGPNAVLDVGFNRLIYETIQQDPTAMIVTQPFIGCSLATIEFEDQFEFVNLVTENNYRYLKSPEFDRVHVELVDGVMQLTNLSDLDPNSPTFGRTVHARSKAEFPRTSDETILIRFSYLFDTADPDVELVVYLSDVPDLLDANDPARIENYLEIARISTPPFPKPGSAGSDRFGIFEKVVSTEGLDLSDGTWIELELADLPTLEHIRLFSADGDVVPAQTGSGNSSVGIDSLKVQVFCSSGHAGDWTGDFVTDILDYLKSVSAIGFPLNQVRHVTTGDSSCAEICFCADGYIDVFDMIGYDLKMKQGVDTCVAAMNVADQQESSPTNTHWLYANGDSDVNVPGDHLLVLGKKGAEKDRPEEKVKDGLYVFNVEASSDDACVKYLQPSPDRCNIRLVQDTAGQLYQICVDTGIVQLSPLGKVIIPVGTVDYSGPDLRNGTSAKVYIGIQPAGTKLAGRPVLDAAFDDEYVYITPVLVDTGSGIPYAAAAKLVLWTDETDLNHPYEVIRLYDSPYHNCNNPREIEIGSDGSVYVLNVHLTTDSDVLVKYDPNGKVGAYIELTTPPVKVTYGDLSDPDRFTEYLATSQITEELLPNDVNLSDPIAMYLSNSTNTLYMTSALYDPCNINTSTIYGFSGDDLTQTRTIKINGIQHVTGITEQPGNQHLWIVGFSFFDVENIPIYPNPDERTFYDPWWAEVPPGGDVVVNAAWIPTGTEPDRVCAELVLPTSVIWRVDTSLLSNKNSR